MLGAAVIVLANSFFDVFSDADVTLIGKRDAADQINIFHDRSI